MLTVICWSVSDPPVGGNPRNTQVDRPVHCSRNLSTVGVSEEEEEHLVEKLRRYNYLDKI